MATDGDEALRSFREHLYGSFTSWGDALFELCDAVLCGVGPVSSIPSLSLEPEFSRSHGSLYKALRKGRINEDRLRRLLVANRPVDWPAVFAVDASTWARCDAETSPGRGFYYSASTHSAGQPIVAGWSYQWISQLSWAPDSWTAPLDAMRVPPGSDATSATVEQIRRLVGLLPEEGEVPLFVLDAGYDPIAIGHDLSRRSRRGPLPHPRRPRLLRGSSSSPQPTTGERRTASTARQAVEVLRPCDLDDAAGQPRRHRSPLRHRHGHCLARRAPAAVVPGSLVDLPSTPDRQGQRDPSRSRAPPETDRPHKEDALAVVVGRG